MSSKRKLFNIDLRKEKRKYKKHRIYNDLSSTPYSICEEKKEPIKEKFNTLITKDVKMDEKELTEDELYELYY